MADAVGIVCHPRIDIGGPPVMEARRRLQEGGAVAAEVRENLHSRLHDCLSFTFQASLFILGDGHSFLNPARP